MNTGQDRSSRSVSELLRREDWRGAHAICLERLEKNDGDWEALAGLAAIAEAHGNIVQASALYGRARRSAPHLATYAAHQARLLSLASRPAEAIEAAQAAIDLQPADPVLLDILGVVLSRAGRHSDALALFTRATAARPEHGPGWLNCASALRFCGDFKGAEEAYERAIAIDPRNAEAWLGLVGLRSQAGEDGRREALEALWEMRGPDPDEALRIGHALAKLCEDHGDIESAMGWLERAKAAKAASVGHRPEDTDRLYAAAAAASPAGGPGRSDEPALPGPRPVFIVGAPRTGTTLVDRILSGHPELVSIGESSAFSMAVKQLAGTRSNRVVDEETLLASRSLPPRAIGEAYVRATAAAGEGKGRTVDKMPLNLLYAGLIARALPDARIVALVRHPLDTVLANWRQLFAPQARHYDHNWSLEHVARWVVALERLASHWRAILPDGQYMSIAYEEIVGAQEPATRRLLDFCGVGWDESCLSFHLNDTPTATASAVQVRQPIHRRSVGGWRRVAAHLAPAARVLRDAGLIDVDGRPAGCSGAAELGVA